MRLFISISFLFLLVCQNVQGSDLETFAERHVINPGTYLFQVGEQFTDQEDNGIVLQVESSKPSIKKVPVIQLGNASNPPKHMIILGDNSTVFNIISGKKCVGKVTTDIKPSDVGQVYIRKIDVDRDFQRKGIGTKAIKLVVDAYQDRFKIGDFAAQIKADNIASQRIFQKNGFSSNKSDYFAGMYAYFLKAS